LSAKITIITSTSLTHAAIPSLNYI